MKKVLQKTVPIKNENKEIKKPRGSQRKETIEQNEMHHDWLEACNLIELGISNYVPYVDLLYDTFDNVDIGADEIWLVLVFVHEYNFVNNKI